jgi:hypothetical protein
LIYYAASELWLTFTFRGESYDAVLATTSHTLSTPADRFLFGDTAAKLYRGSDGHFSDLGVIPSGTSPSTKTYNATVPWSAVETTDGHTPKPGEPIQLVAVHSFYSPYVASPHNSFVDPTGTVKDLPVATDDAAFPDGTVFSVPGAVGDLSLTTPLAVRYSNGEATTIHWPVEVANHGSRDLDVSLHMDGPEGGDARLPESVHVPAGSNRTVSVYVTLPFAHQHGSQRSFPLTATSPFGDKTSLHLGVLYPTVPQPSGHHPDLYVHSAQYSTAGQSILPGPAWMNALEDDPASTSDHIGGGIGSCPTAGTTPTGGSTDVGIEWLIPLDPSLRIGLDGHYPGTASLDAALLGKAALPAGKLYGELLLESETRDNFALFSNATRLGSAAIPQMPGPSRVPAHLDMPMPAQLDLVPPTAHDNLVLGLLYCIDAPSPTGFAINAVAGFAYIVGAEPYDLASGAHLVLPLNEYHDLIPVESGTGPRITIDTPVVHAASGATVLWKPSVTFADGHQATYKVRLLGTGATDAVLHGPDHVDATDHPIQLAVSMKVPEGPAGQVTDLVLDLTATNDPADTGALRLAVLTDPAATLDQSKEVAALGVQAKHSPTPTLGLLVIAVALAAVRRR